MTLHEAEAGSEQPVDRRPAIRSLTVDDLKDILARGFADFRAVPTHLIFLLLIYPAIGLLAARVSAGEEILPIVWPLLAGFTLIGPVFATGMYELSRRREAGLPVNRFNLFSVLQSPSLGAIVMLGIVQVVIYVLWIVVARALYDAMFPGDMALSLYAFLEEILTTETGWMLIGVGSAVGLVFAAVVLAVSAVSFPMLLDRRVDATTAMVTSIRASLTNPLVMAVWGLIVAVSLLAAALPFLVGLAVVMPVLGHATWHLYRKVVAD